MGIFYNIIFALAGLGVMLYGISVMNKGLEGCMGLGFKRAISKSSKSLIQSYGIGAGITGVLQTSVLTISMIVGFVNIGAIGLTQAMAMVLGTSAGSSLAAIVMAFESINLLQIFTLFCFLGAFILMFFKKSKAQLIGQALMGFGLLCLGITLISMGMSVITEQPAVSQVLSSVTNPILLILIGLVLSVLLNSMLPVLALLIVLCGSADAVGPVTIQSACFVLFGANMGTGITNLWVNKFGDSVNSKRILLFNLITKIIGSLIFCVILITPFADWLHSLCGNETSITLVVMILLVCIVPSFLMIPLVKPFEKLMRVIVKSKSSKGNIYDTFDIDENTLKTPGLAHSTVLSGVSKIVEMEVCLSNKLCQQLFEKKDNDKGVRRTFTGIEKAIKLSTNNAVRISGLQGESTMELTNNLIYILGDTGHALKVCTRLEEFSVDNLKRGKGLIKEQIEILRPICLCVNELGTKVSKYVCSTQTIEEKQEILREMFEEIDISTKLIGKAKHKLFDITDCKKQDNSIYLNMLYEFGKLGTDFMNIAIKTSLMEV